MSKNNYLLENGIVDVPEKFHITKDFTCFNFPFALNNCILIEIQERACEKILGSHKIYLQIVVKCL